MAMGLRETPSAFLSLELVSKGDGSRLEPGAGSCNTVERHLHQAFCIHEAPESGKIHFF